MLPTFVNSTITCTALGMTYLLLFLIGVLPGAFMTFIGAGHLWNYVHLSRAEPIDIGRLTGPTGAVELTGTARRHEETSRSPFTASESLIHQWTVKEYRPSPGDEGSDWSRLASGDATHSFILEGETGAALVDTAGASPYLQTTTTIDIEGDQSPPTPIKEFLASTDQVDAGHTRLRRYSESRLDPGAPVYVYGPIRETASASDEPRSVDAVVGVENPDRPIEVGEDSLSTIMNKITSDNEQFIISNSSEKGAEGQMLKIGGVFFGIGLLFLAVSFVLLVV